MRRSCPRYQRRTLQQTKLQQRFISQRTSTRSRKTRNHQRLRKSRPSSRATNQKSQVSFRVLQEQRYRRLRLRFLHTSKQRIRHKAHIIRRFRQKYTNFNTRYQVPSFPQSKRTPTSRLPRLFSKLSPFRFTLKNTRQLQHQPHKTSHRTNHNTLRKRRLQEFSQRNHTTPRRHPTKRRRITTQGCLQPPTHTIKRPTLQAFPRQRLSTLTTSSRKHRLTSRPYQLRLPTSKLCSKHHTKSSRRQTRQSHRSLLHNNNSLRTHSTCHISLQRRLRVRTQAKLSPSTLRQLRRSTKLCLHRQPSSLLFYTSRLMLRMRRITLGAHPRDKHTPTFPIAPPTTQGEHHLHHQHPDPVPRVHYY